MSASHYGEQWSGRAIQSYASDNSDPQFESRHLFEQFLQMSRGTKKHWGNLYLVVIASL